MAAPRERRDPYLWEALVSILALIITVGSAIVIYEADARIPILFGVLIAALVGLRVGFTWKDIEIGMLNGITNSLVICAMMFGGIMEKTGQLNCSVI